MNAIKKLYMAAAVAGALLSSGANASLFLNGEVDLSGQGYGNAHRLITVQGQGSNTFESGAIGISGGMIVALTPGISDASVFMGNGVQNLGGDTVEPLTDALKHGIPTLGTLNWMSGADVNLLFNAAEPGGNGLTVEDVTLKFYNGDNVITAIDGSFSLASTNMGTGSSGFLVSVDAAQQIHLNSVIFNQAGFGDYRIALETTITSVGGGAESFSAIASPIPEPETYGMMIAGLGLLGFIARRRKTNALKVA